MAYTYPISDTSNLLSLMTTLQTGLLTRAVAMIAAVPLLESTGTAAAGAAAITAAETIFQTFMNTELTVMINNLKNVESSRMKMILKLQQDINNFLKKISEIK